ncbi:MULTISPECIES: N-acetyltransferase [unclassified Streptomyces]|uniref:N-acetyltransferase n=1 Tax=unclassified Streptomyces TaxID=2593676 RepID=UPI002E31BAAE|nr:MULTISPECIES: N-acetyltransferase [unclassified Streptomyces]WUC67248.1 N-acetyltransferase [Streptomyces sp. NBC_00539]
MTGILITTLAQRPELTGRLWDMANPWPEFARQDPVSSLLYPWMVAELNEYVFIATDGDEVVARAFSVPFALHADGRGALPVRGWDQVLMWACADRRDGTRPDTVSAIEITVAPGRQGQGLSPLMLAAMRDNARAHGFAEVVAPVRPNGKPAEPDTPMEEYAFRTREDGLPCDPWLRVHVRAGAVIDSVAPLSMTISGSLAQWREWTGLPFDAPGPVRVPGALVPVHCEPQHDHAVYVEPNVWVRHPLG